MTADEKLLGKHLPDGQKEFLDEPVDAERAYRRPVGRIPLTPPVGIGCKECEDGSVTFGVEEDSSLSGNCHSCGALHELVAEVVEA